MRRKVVFTKQIIRFQAFPANEEYNSSSDSADKIPMTESNQNEALPQPIRVQCENEPLDELLTKEWLLTNNIGAFASSTVIGCNTRRYHGLLTAATSPPVGRIAALSSVMEKVSVGDTTYELATNEFPSTFSPHGVDYLAEFCNDIAPRYVYRLGDIELTKEIILAESANSVAIRYSVSSGPATLHLWPFVSLRDFHHLRRVHQPHQITFEQTEGGVFVEDRNQTAQPLHLISKDAEFSPRPQWWYQFCYRAEMARGQDCFEDLYTPGFFVCELQAGQFCQLTASFGDPLPLGFSTTVERRRERLAKLTEDIQSQDETTRRLATATDAFVAKRHFPSTNPKATILAGFPWFADWGRDAFIALPGLLLETKQFQQAREVFSTFAEAISDGMIPNRFDDYSTNAHYNSIDASLWFIVAAERYVEACGDETFWNQTLFPAAEAILKSYHDGTKFDIHAGADGLIFGGSKDTQLTWMDAKLGDEAITPRHGKAVEINSLWHSAHRIMAQRSHDKKLSEHYEHRAELIASSFIKAFWNPTVECLYDAIPDRQADASIRPNQIFAVSLPHCPLSKQQQKSVVDIVGEKLLTPMGLRTLSPDDSRYRNVYGSSWESRDRAYHQGTVWAWLIGPYIEAYLKVEDFAPHALTRAKLLLSSFDSHLNQVGLGYISEIFDGDTPHTPRGCIAQAWSVAEVLRAKKLIERHQK